MKNNSIRSVVAAGIGAALFVVIGILVNIPVLIVPNTTVQLQYAVQALLATIFGPIVGFLVGFLGHAFKDALQYGSPWWSWVIASGIVGLVIGLAKKYIAIDKGPLTAKTILIFNLAQIAANAVAWGVVAPRLDIAIYKESAEKVIAQGIVAAGLNSVTVAFAGTLLLYYYAKSQTQSDSLSQE